MQAKKSLGQNFLRDKEILKKIVDFARIEPTDTVVEVGPGEGTLTKFLLERAKKVIAVEKDGRMVEFLKEKFSKEIKEKKIEIIAGDILSPQVQKCLASLTEASTRNFSAEKYPCISGLVAKKYLLVGNIPYYITGALFKKFLESENPPASIIFVVQKEVAERIMARDGKESILSISIKAYGKPEFGGIIKAGSFYPKPKVDSAIISVRNIRNDLIPNPSPCKGEGRKKEKEKRFFEILKAGFAHKRKFLIKNLAKKVSRTGLDRQKNIILSQIEVSRTGLDMLRLREIFKKCGIPEKARAENLKVENWICLTKELV